MADVQELKPYQRKRKRRSRFLRTLILSLIVIGVFLFVAFSEGWIDEDFFAQLVTKPKGYPAAVVGGTPQSIFASDKHIVLLTDTDIVFYDEYGTISSQTVHNCTDPHVIVKNNKVMVYDKGYSFYQIQDKSGVIHSASISNRLTNADLADNGSYAISTTSTRYLSEMSVYNKNNTEICYWRSVNSYISSMAFSKNSKKLAVASIYAEDGYFKSSIRIFDLNKEDPVICEVDFFDSAVVKVQYLNSGKILAIFDNCYLILDEDGNTVKEYKFNSDSELYFQNVDADGGVIVLKGSDQKLLLNRIYSDNFSADTQFYLDQTDFKSLTYSDDSIFVLKDSEVYEYLIDGTFGVKIKELPDTFEICQKDDSIYALNFTQIESYD